MNSNDESHDLNGLFVAMGENFAELTTNKGQIFEIEKYPAAEMFIEQLLRRNIVSKKKETKKKIKVLINE